MLAIPNNTQANMPAQNSADKPSKGRTLRSVGGRSRRARRNATRAKGTFIRNNQGQLAIDRIAEAAVGPTEKAMPTTKLHFGHFSKKSNDFKRLAKSASG